MYIFANNDHNDYLRFIGWVSETNHRNIAGKILFVKAPTSAEIILFLTNSSKHAKNYIVLESVDMAEDIESQGKKSKFNSITRSLARRGFFLFVKTVDKYAPDRLLLFGLNFLDRHVPNRLISFAIKAVEKLVSNRLRSFVIAAADEYVPDEVANSRKVCAVLAGVGKYIPDEIIPPESTGRWDNLRTKFHIPKLISSRQK
jgi:hypothetical protein